MSSDSDSDSERHTGQPATPEPSAVSAGHTPAEAYAPAPTSDAAAQPLPQWLIMLLRDDSPLMRCGS